MELINDNIYIYDGIESQGKYINFISGNRTSNMFYQTSNGETMEIVFKRYFNFSLCLCDFQSKFDNP